MDTVEESGQKMQQAEIQYIPMDILSRLRLL